MPLPGSQILRRTFALVRKAAQNLTSVYSSSWQSNWLSGWSIREPFAGAWQRNITADPETSILASSVVYACVTGIASDVAKLRIKLDKNVDGIWEEIISDSPWLPVLRKPNHYQNRIEFLEQWIASKLLAGNMYALKQRQDKRGIVTALYVLDPRRVKPLVAENGDVYYELSPDYLSGVTEQVTVPASEIIHDRMFCLWHPLVGVPPIYACSMSATMGNRIQANSTNLFANASIPSGILTAPGAITNETAQRLKKSWEENYGGVNRGRTAVLGDGLKFELTTMSAEASQLTEQLKWTVEDVGRAFHYPQWKLGGAVPPYSAGPQAITVQYYTDCLQTLIEKVELCLDEGLELPVGQGTEMDLDNLLRMDTVALYESNNKADKWMKVDEMRFRANLGKITGGNTVYRQHQDYSIESLAKRDAQEDPFKNFQQQQIPPVPPVTPPEEKKPKQVNPDELGDETARVLKWCLSLSLAQIVEWSPET